MSNWTFHRTTLIAPHQEPVYFDTHPIGRVKPKGRFACKYCYTTHRDWYQMDPKDYALGARNQADMDVILCGNCGHTSLREHAETA